MRVSRLLTCAATSLSFVVFAAAFAFPTRALAQQAAVSDADRKAARDLFFQGVELQNAGKFAEALDKFQRAQSVINAPTNLLHIAECQAATNKLVEAAETYRAVGRYPLGANPPQPFVAAQSQAAGELAQLEPRIPEVTIDVLPANIPTLQVTVDDQPINNALFGVSRALNPGPHKIVAQAPGYTREEKLVDVKERSKQKVTLELRSTGAVTYGAAGTATPATGAATTPPATPTGQTSQTGQPVQTAPEKPAPYDASKQAEPHSRTSLMIGLRLGATIPTGKLPIRNAAGNSSSDISDFSKTGGAVALEGAFRFVRVLYVGALLQGESYGDGSLVKLGQRDSSGGIAALTGGWISNPDGFGVILNAGVGYRWYTLEDSIVAAGGNQKLSATGSGAAFQLGVGMHIRMGKIFRLIPKVEADFGSIGSSDTSIPLVTKDRTKTAFIFIGLGGHFDLNLDKTAPAPTPTATAPK